MISAIAFVSLGLAGQYDIPLKAEYYLTSAGRLPLPIEKVMEPGANFPKVSGKVRARVQWTNTLALWLADLDERPVFDAQLLRVNNLGKVTAAFDLKSVSLSEIGFPILTQKGGGISPLDLHFTPQSSKTANQHPPSIMRPRDGVYKVMRYALKIGSKKATWADMLQRFSLHRTSSGYVGEIDINLLSTTQAPATPDAAPRVLTLFMESKGRATFYVHLLMEHAFVSSEAASKKAHIRAVGIRFGHEFAVK